jgi:hypothetical protein
MLKKRPPKSQPAESISAVANAEGTFTASLTVPVDASFGRYDVISTCPSGVTSGQTLTMSARLTIVPSPATKTKAAVNLTSNGGHQSLASWQTRVPFVATLVVILLGSAAVLVSRGRRHRRRG